MRAPTTTSSRAESRSSVSIVAGLVALCGFALFVWMHFEARATLISDLSSSSPVMGTWRLVADDYGFAARGLAAPAVLTVEPCPSAEAPAGLEASSVARLTAEGRAVLLTSRVVVQHIVPGTGTSPFAQLGSEGDVGMILSLRGWPGWFDRLSIDLGLDDGRPLLDRGSRRLVYRRD